MTNRNPVLLITIYCIVLFTDCGHSAIEKKPAIWRQAKELCEKDESNLAIVKSEKDLRRFDEDADKREIDIDFWAGFEYNRAGNSFYFHNQQGKLMESDCKMWADGEPKKEGNTCAVMIGYAQVYLRSCDEKHFFMCEKAQSGGECDTSKGFTKYDDHCIKAVSVNGDVNNAVKICGDTGGYIARILDETILGFVLNEAHLSKYRKGLWIGLRIVNTYWTYLDETTLTQEQGKEIWADGEPRNGGCAAYSLRHNKKIIALSCLSETYFVCGDDSSSENKLHTKE